MPVAVRFRTSLAALVLLSLAACQNAGNPSEAMSAPSADAQANTSEASPGTAGTPAPPPPGETPADPSTDTLASKRITTGQASVEVRSVAAARAALLAATARIGGYVGSEESSNYDYGRSATLVLRLPAARAAAVDALLDSLGRVTNRTTEVEDVTAAYTDVAARLAARRAVEARYVALLGSARTVADVVTVEQALQQVREEIESAEGQIRLWDRQVAYSTLRVTLSEPGAAVRDGLGSRIGEALRDSVVFLEELLLGLIRLWPLWLLIGGGLWVWRRRRARRMAVVPGTVPAPPRPPVTAMETRDDGA